MVKPDWRIRGGFEKVADLVERDLTAAGHRVERIAVDATAAAAREPFGVPVPPEERAQSPEWFTHLSLLETFRDIEAGHADLVLSTQPPSYAVRHRSHLALFYHHARAFYDLADVIVAAGRVPAEVHRPAAELLRRAEAPDFAGVTRFLAGSPRVAERLHTYQGPDTPVSLYRAAAPPVDEHLSDVFDHVAVVSRHEFSKRTELAVLGLHLAGPATGVLVGTGGREEIVRRLAADLAAGTVDPSALTDTDLWLNMERPTGRPVTGRHPRIDIRGRVEDDELVRTYRDALCVLAPAYDEDDGLTVLEAMAHGKPVIVCRDGGGLTADVVHGVNGFVVDPTGPAIAAAVAELLAQPDLARQMGAAGVETARARTPEKARRQLLTAVERTAAGGR